MRAEPDAPFAVDTETTGLRNADGTDYVIGISVAGVLAAYGGESHYFPIAHETGPNVSRETVELLALALAGRPMVYANVQFDVIGMLYAGIDVRENEFYDICTMATMIDENVPITKSLDQLAKVYVDPEAGKIKDPFVEKEKGSGNHNITGEQMFEYGCVDAELTFAAWAQMILTPQWIELSESTDVWEHKQQTIRVLIEMRMRGIAMNLDVTAELEYEGTDNMARLRAALDFNPGSWKDMHRIFIDELTFPVLKRSKKTGKPSFDNSVMEVYDEMLEEMDSPLARQVKEYRGWQKATTSCYRPYLELTDSDGRMRACFNTHRTVTGRLSSSEPNLQQIPKESLKPWNGRVKECFVPAPGFSLISIDYSQLEYRVLAVYSGEQSLIDIFEQDRDIFTEMAAELGMERPRTKVFVHSTNYGQGVKALAAKFKVTMFKAQQMLNSYKASYPAIAMFNANCQDTAERKGQVRIWSGRVRHFQYASEGYKAMNSVIQGGCADIVERVMVRVFNETESDDCHMLLQVHDALVFEVRTELVTEYSAQIKALMEDVAAVAPAFGKVRFNAEVTSWIE
jgi:DNA polymerase-1